MKQHYFAAFIINEFYYLQIYEYLARLLVKEEKPVLFLLQREFSGRSKKQIEKTLKIEEDFFKEHHFEYKYLDDDLSELTTTYIICASHTYDDYTYINYKYSVLMTHGIGTKKGYFQETNTNYDIQFCEGSYRKKTMEQLFPNAKTKFHNVGYAKLDAAINLSTEAKSKLIKQYTLDPNKKTILYSPTFYPSSIEKIKRNFPEDYQDFNIIIKPHFFSYELKKYVKQRRLFTHWESYPNVYLAKHEEFNLVPFMAAADVMITDESSAMFEFMALNKPVICYRDVKLRLSYRLNKSKLKRRMDTFMSQFQSSFKNVYAYPELHALVMDAIANPNKDQKERMEMTEKLVGKTDGKVCQRIVDILQSFSKDA